MATVPIPQQAPSPQTGQVNQGLLDRIKSLASSLAPQMSQLLSPQGQANSVGGTTVSPGQTGVVPSVAAPVPSVSSLPMPQGVAPTNVNGGGVAQRALQEQQPIQSRPLHQSGVSFPDATAAKTATVHDIFSNLSDTVSEFKARRDQQIQTRAKVVTASLYDAINRKDEGLINTILSDPKNLKILEKSGIGVPPEITVDQKPSPEKTGVMQGVKYSIAAKPSQQEQQASNLQATQAQTAQLAASQQLGDLSQEGDAGVAARRLAASGTALSPDQMKQAEEFRAGFEPSPVMKLQIGSAALTEATKLATMLTQSQFENDTKVLMNKYEVDARTKIAAGQLDEAKLYHDQVLKHYDLMNDIARTKMDFSQKLVEAKTDGETTEAYNKLATGMINVRKQVQISYDNAAKRGDDQEILDGYTKQLRGIDDQIEQTQNTIKSIKAFKQMQAIINVGGDQPVE